MPRSGKENAPGHRSTLLVWEAGAGTASLLASGWKARFQGLLRKKRKSIKLLRKQVTDKVNAISEASTSGKRKGISNDL